MSANEGRWLPVWACADCRTLQPAVEDDPAPANCWRCNGVKMIRDEIKIPDHAGVGTKKSTFDATDEGRPFIGEDHKLLAFGRMVWDMIQRVAAQRDDAYAARVVTFPLTEDRSVKGAATLIIATDQVAKAAEDGIKQQFSIRPLEGGAR